MTLTYPTSRKEVADRMKTDLQNELPESDPFLRNSYLAALVASMAGTLYDAYKTIQVLQTQLFPDTATGEFADRWGAFKGIIRNPASISIGNINITGTVGAAIPLGTALQTANGLQYVTTNPSIAYIAAKTLFLTSLVRSGSVVTATTVSAHGFANGNNVTISGVAETDYNGTYPITVTSTTTFTYTITATPVTPASGVMLATLNCISCPIKSVDLGADTVLASGSELIFNTPLAGVDSSAFVDFNGIVGGEDQESDADYRNRYLYVYQHPVAFFNVAELTTQAKLVSGVTRVFVEEITPDVGQVTIYFTRDNDTVIIPTPTEITAVKNQILLIKPAHVDPDDIIVKAPTPVVIDFDFNLIDPATDTMKNAIIASLQALFAEVPIVGQSLSQYAYTSAIYQTVDPSTGAYVTAFSLTNPLGDITISDGQLAVLGTITFPS